MESFIYYSIEANLYLLVVLASYYWGVRRSSNFQFNRSFLLGGIGISLLLPLIKTSITVPAFTETPIIRLQEIVITPLNRPEQAAVHSKNILVWIYLLGVSLASLRLFHGLYQILQLKSRSIKRKEFYEVPDSRLGFSFMGLIFIGADLSKKEQAIILKHERIHLKHYHSLDILLAKFLEVIFFYSPPIYFFRSLFSEVHEFEADRHAADCKETYIKHLLQQHFEVKKISIVHQFNFNHLKSRIMRIQKNEIIKSNKLIIFIGLFLVGSIFIACQSENETPENNTNNQTKEAQNLDKNKRSIAIKDGAYRNAIAKDDSLSVEKTAEFPGGMEKMFLYIQENTQYPEEAKKEGIEGKVFVRLTIGSNGKIIESLVLRGVNEMLDQEALRVFNTMPEWIPAEKDGQNVPVSMVIPLNFQLNESEEEAKKATFSRSDDGNSKVSQE